MADQTVVPVSRLLDERGLDLVPHHADGLDRAARTHRRLRHRRHCGGLAASGARVASAKSRRARAGAQREPDRHPVRFGHLRLDRRPLRPQGRAHCIEPPVRHPHLDRGLRDQSRTDVLAAADRRHRHRRRHSERGRHQRGIRAAPAARDAGARHSRLRAARRRLSGHRGGSVGTDARLADDLSDRRHRADRRRAGGDLRPV